MVEEEELPIDEEIVEDEPIEEVEEEVQVDEEDRELPVEDIRDDVPLEPEPEPVEEVVEEIVEKTDAEKLADINDKYLRLYSDFDNFRKRKKWCISACSEFSRVLKKQKIHTSQ